MPRQTAPTAPDGPHTVAEVAASLRVSRGAIYEEIKRGTLPVLRVGGSIRITDEALRGYIAAGGTPSALSA